MPTVRLATGHPLTYVEPCSRSDRQQKPAVLRGAIELFDPNAMMKPDLQSSSSAEPELVHSKHLRACQVMLCLMGYSGHCTIMNAVCLPAAMPDCRNPCWMALHVSMAVHVMMVISVRVSSATFGHACPPG